MFRRGLSFVWGALRENWIAAVGIWGLAIFFVVSYYQGGLGLAAASEIMKGRACYGLLFPVAVEVVFCALLPTLTQVLFMPSQRRNAIRRLPLFVAFWAYRGLETDFFYRFQAWLWGSQTDFGTALCKVLTDQFVYNFWAATQILLALRLIARVSGELPAGELVLAKDWFRKLVMPVAIASWIVWIPTMSVFYMLPTPLQMPVSSAITWLWSLMLLFMAKQRA